MKDKFVDQEEVKDFLFSIYEKNRIGNSYLFTGDKGVGKFRGALEFAKLIKCSNAGVDGSLACNSCKTCREIDNLRHPDVDIIFPLPSRLGKRMDEISDNALEELKGVYDFKKENKYKYFDFSKKTSIRIGVIQNLIEEKLSQTSSKKGGRIAIIVDAHEMLNQAANAFLKTLEEPPEDTYLILTSHNPQKLLPTILSRAQRVPFKKIPTEVIYEYIREKKENLSKERADTAANIAEGSIGRALEVLKPEYQELKKEAVDCLQKIFEGGYNDLLLWAEGIDNKTDISPYKNLKSLLEIMYSIVNDCLIYKSTNNEELLKNIDLIDFQNRILKAGLTLPKLNKLPPHFDDSIIRLQNNPNKELHLLETIFRAKDIVMDKE